MKRTLPLLYCLFTLALFTACRKEKDKDNPEPPSKGAVRPVGAIVAPAVNKEIGPEGGVISSQDGGITITIPAGALAAATELGVQRIENTNPGGIGSGYRITPGDLTFKKPVSIALSYAATELLVQHISTLGAAYQDDKGIWQYVTPPMINIGLKTVTVSSTHAGDWSLMLWMFMNPYFADLNVNSTQVFEAKRVLPLAIQEGILKPKAPKTGHTIPVEEVQALETQFIQKWEITGAGTLTADGAKATYKAPATVPPDFDIIALHLNQESVKMVSKVRVNGSMVQYRIDEGEWNILSAQLKPAEDGLATIHSTDGKSFELTFNNHLGERPFTHTEQFRILDAAGEFNYRSIYTAVWEGRDSPGNINITSLETESGYLTGTFTATSAGKYPVAGGFNKSVHKVEGKFKVKNP